MYVYSNTDYTVSNSKFILLGEFKWHNFEYWRFETLSRRELSPTKVVSIFGVSLFHFQEGLGWVIYLVLFMEVTLL